MKPEKAAITLNNGITIPRLGLGVYKAEDGSQVISAIHEAVKAGYRLIDTAAVYENEQGVGEAVRTADISREELFVTTKVWNDRQGYEETLAAFEESREKLGLDVIDLYLVHWPVTGKFKDTWRALEKLYKEGSVRAIGVSNFNIHHLETLLEDAEVVPAVNQMEFHPLLTLPELHAYCREKGIQLQAWSPLTRGRIFNDPLIQELSVKYGRSPAQIILRWDVQKEVVTIPKSVTPERIRENAQIFDFELNAGDMERIDAMNRHHRFSQDPDTFV
ncbi:aldo/keto reductase [Alteribacter natronophilus]|uniref:aldo/keto reductase n=1 Tax=Alteribacter natronophilus TaxID=2583810 RepID=UPI00110DE250|nr:aldo/keto reductase [Alteribacter natronophilus]TMW72101.1 aldo/keto reductase [Alteribacter natronophilus]